MNREFNLGRSLAFALLLSVSAAAWSQESPPTVIPAPAVHGPRPTDRSEKADLAGGCYWGTQGIFEQSRASRGSSPDSPRGGATMTAAPSR